MKGITGWGYRPYRPAYSADEARAPFVVRIAPHEDWFEAEWLDNGAPQATHRALWRRKGAQDEFAATLLSGNTFAIRGLEQNCD